MTRLWFISPEIFNSFSRQVLLGYALSVCGADPSFFSLEVSPSGKPVIKQPEGWYYNISHTPGCACLALSNSGEVGCDVQVEKPSALRTLPRACTQEEALWIDSLASDERVAAFTRVWAIKEALYKQIGVGIAGGLQNISVDPLGLSAGPQGVTYFTNPGTSVVAGAKVQCGIVDRAALLQREAHPPIHWALAYIGNETPTIHTINTASALAEFAKEYRQ